MGWAPFAYNSSHLKLNTMLNPLVTKREKAGRDNPNLLIYILLSIVSLLIAKSVQGALVTFTASGILMLFILSYMSKPIADIQVLKDKILLDEKKIDKANFNQNTETNPQRKRYLRSINDVDNIA